MKFKPLADRVLIEPAKPAEKTAGGIIIPAEARSKAKHGIVVAVGPGKVNEPMTVKYGDTVLYGDTVGTEIKSGGTSFLMMREEELYGILTEDK